MILDKKQIKLLKDLEIKLHYAHEAIREFNKDIHCDDGQEYPVPFVSNDLKSLITDDTIFVREKYGKWEEKKNE